MAVICIHCGNYVLSLYRRLSTSNSIVLQSCNSCKAIADPYVEYEDGQVLLLEVPVFQTTAYRHLGVQPNHMRNGHFLLVLLLAVLMQSLVIFLGFQHTTTAVPKGHNDIWYREGEYAKAIPWLELYEFGHWIRITFVCKATVFVLAMICLGAQEMFAARTPLHLFRMWCLTSVVPLFLDVVILVWSDVILESKWMASLLLLHSLFELGGQVCAIFSFLPPQRFPASVTSDGKVDVDVSDYVNRRKLLLSCVTLLVAYIGVTLLALAAVPEWKAVLPLYSLLRSHNV